MPFPLDSALAGFAAGVVVGGAVAAAVLRATRGRRAVAYAEQLRLIAHPEGGFFLETYRAGSVPMASKGQTDPSGALVPAPDRTGGQRNCMTSIYYMLTKSSPVQYWANNRSDHVHYWHGGGHLVYHVVAPDGRLSRHVLGPECPQVVVQGGSFKCAELEEGSGEYVLLGEAVGPGFDFRDFAFVTAAELSALLPDLADFKRLSRFLKERPESSFDDYYNRPTMPSAASATAP